MQQQLKGQWALITGASSGFGVDFAHLLAELGANLILVARRTEPMQALASELQKRHGTETRVIGLDLAQAEAASTLKAQTDALGLSVDILINNAGYGLFGEFLAQPLMNTRDMLQLNMLTLTELTHHYSPDMARREPA